MKALLLVLFSIVNSYAYVDMSDVSSRAADLGLTTQDYTYMMAQAGTALGLIFGLFLWKVR